MAWIFLGGFVSSLVPALIVWVVWTLTSAVKEIEEV